MIAARPRVDIDAQDQIHQVHRTKSASEAIAKKNGHHQTGGLRVKRGLAEML